MYDMFHRVSAISLIKLDSKEVTSLCFRSCYSSHGAYSQSKLALVLFTYHLQEQLWTRGDPLTTNAIDPGVVDTDLYQNLCTPAQLAKKPMAKLLFRVR